MDIKHSVLYKAIKRNQFIYFLKMRLTDKDYIVNKKEMKSSSVKTPEEIKEEMQLVADYWKCKPLHYVRYRLFAKNLSKDELLDYIPSYYLYCFRNEAMYQKYNIDYKLYDDKLKMFFEFKERGVLTPEVIAVVRNGELEKLDGASISLDPLTADMKVNDKLFFKPYLGAGGTGIKVLKKTEDGFKCENKTVQLDSFTKCLNKSAIYIVEYGIKQRADIAAINPSSVSTLRSVTQCIDGKVQLKYCIMRIGRNGKDVDNSAQGGISVQIDVNTGVFADYATAEHGGGQIYSHPDSGFVFKGAEVKDFAHIRKCIESYAKKFPELLEVAWDVVVMDGDPMIIELNNGFGIEHIQCTCAGARRVLGIYPER